MSAGAGGSTSPAIATLPAAPGVRAALHRPTGTLLVSDRHHQAHGQIDDIERFAATLIAACWEARQAGVKVGGVGEMPTCHGT